MIDVHAAVQGKRKKILFCENDGRIISACLQLAKEENIIPIFVGENKQLEEAAIKCIPIQPQRYAQQYYELRKHKGISLEDARQTLEDPAFFSCMLLLDKKADGLVCGASWPTANTIRPALHILRKDIASSYFIMKTHKGEFIFADCAFNVQPTQDQLKEIAINTATQAEKLGVNVRIAMLSHSSEGSASNPDQEKVMNATTAVQEYIIQQKKEWKVGGELQVDAAMSTQVAKHKAPHSPVQGDANVFVFPDLDAGNIGYKLVQRFCDAQAIGPIMTGFSQPVNDLSRGCTVEEIIQVAYMTAWQSL